MLSRNGLKSSFLSMEYIWRHDDPHRIRCIDPRGITGIDFVPPSLGRRRLEFNFNAFSARDSGRGAPSEVFLGITVELSADQALLPSPRPGREQRGAQIISSPP